MRLAANSKLRLVINEQLSNVNSALLNVDGCFEVEENGRVEVENNVVCGESSTVITYDCEEAPLTMDNILFVDADSNGHEAE